MKYLICLFLLSFNLIFALTEQDIDLIKEKELWDLAKLHQKDLLKFTVNKPDSDSAWDILEEITRLQNDSLSLLDLYKKRAIAQTSMKSLS